MLENLLHLFLSSPAGWDNDKKIGILHENFQTLKAEDNFEDIITKPPVRKVTISVNGLDIQAFTLRGQFLCKAGQGARSVMWLFLMCKLRRICGSKMQISCSVTESYLAWGVLVQNTQSQYHSQLTVGLVTVDPKQLEQVEAVNFPSQSPKPTKAMLE